jgi:predicted protein tyrosine phosphatase
MNVHAFSAHRIQTSDLPGRSALVCMADTPSLLAHVKDSANVIERLDLIFNDAGDDFGAVRSPTDEDARKILEFYRRHEASAPHLVFQCQVGIGRSLAATAAILRLRGGDYLAVLDRGTHNRALYRKMIAAAGIAPDPEPLVSLAVRVKYTPDKMLGFLLSIQRQRYDNWELIFVTDGPNPGAYRIVEEARDARVRLLETAKSLGLWGHPYRQLGMDACRGELIGISNDDNYYVPGYLEQMVNALQRQDAELALCGALHNYWGWRPIEPGRDLGSWLARASLVRRSPWTGEDFFSDVDYIALLEKNAAGRVVMVDRPLLVHN